MRLTRQIAVGGTIALLLLAVLFAVGWIVQGNEFFMYRFFAPRQEAVRRQVFEESKAYNQGMVQELQNMQFEYIRASKEHKGALASIILHRVADYNESRLPDDLRKFIQELRNSINNR